MKWTEGPISMIFLLPSSRTVLSFETKNPLIPEGPFISTNRMLPLIRVYLVSIVLLVSNIFIFISTGIDKFNYSDQ